MTPHQAELIREAINHLDNNACRCVADNLPDATCQTCKAVAALHDVLGAE